MKILKLFVVAIAVFTLSACGNDDDSTRDVELTIENLAGTYELTFFEDFYELSETASNGSEVIIETEVCIGDTFTNALLTLNTDGTFTTSGNFREVCELTINGETTTEEFIVPFVTSGLFSANDASNTITISGDSNDVELFDGNRLYLTSVEVFTFDDETERTETEIRFEKIN